MTRGYNVVSAHYTVSVAFKNTFHTAIVPAASCSRHRVHRGSRRIFSEVMWRVIRQSWTQCSSAADADVPLVWVHVGATGSLALSPFAFSRLVRLAAALAFHLELMRWIKWVGLWNRKFFQRGRSQSSRADEVPAQRQQIICGVEFDIFG